MQTQVLNTKHKDASIAKVITDKVEFEVKRRPGPKKKRERDYPITISHIKMLSNQDNTIH